MFQSVLHFWFEEISPEQRWKADAAFDQMLAQRFSVLHKRAVQAELYEWRLEPAGRLAEIIVLDQFSRNLHRSDPRAFAADPMALALAQEAVALKVDLALPAEQRVFLYMPFMHSESPLIHETAERLFRENGIQDSYDFELKHKAIIDRFGRYPHRNAVLGRHSTHEEATFLQQPGSPMLQVLAAERALPQAMLAIRPAEIDIAPYPNLANRLARIEARPAVTRADAFGEPLKSEGTLDETARTHLFGRS